MTPIYPVEKEEVLKLSDGIVSVEKLVTPKKRYPQPLFCAFTMGSLIFLSLVEMLCKGLKLQDVYIVVESPEFPYAVGFLGTFKIQLFIIAQAIVFYFYKNVELVKPMIYTMVFGMILTTFSIVRLAIMSVCSCLSTDADFSILRIIHTCLNEIFIPSFDRTYNRESYDVTIMYLFLALIVAAVKIHILYKMTVFVQRIKEHNAKNTEIKMEMSPV